MPRLDLGKGWRPGTLTAMLAQDCHPAGLRQLVLHVGREGTAFRLIDAKRLTDTTFRRIGVSGLRGR
jgi:hypothetical protein